MSPSQGRRRNQRGAAAAAELTAAVVKLF